MIKHLKIENFQSHKLTDLEFSPGVNAIVGASDEGKSAIIKAFIWAATNKPGGDKFRSKWGGDTKVTISTNTKEIVRIKANENVYKLNKKVFKAFGSSVPDDIKNALNIDAINIQKQMDAPFLLSSTPGEIGKTINGFVNLKKIDSTLKNIAGTLKKEKYALSDANISIAKKRKEINDLAWVKVACDQITSLEAMDEAVTFLNATKLALNNSISEIQDVQEILAGKGKNLASIKQIGTMEVLINEIKSIKDTRINLAGVINKIQANKNETKAINKNTNSLKRIEKLTKLVTEVKIAKYTSDQLDATLTKINNMDDKINVLNKNTKAAIRIEELIELDTGVEKQIKQYNSIESSLDALDKIIVGIKNKQQKLSDLKHSLDEAMGDFCLLCGAKIKNEKNTK